MKRTLLGLFVLGCVLIAGLALAAGSVTMARDKTGSDDWVLTFTCTGDAADGSFPATASTWNINGYVYMVVTDPGATAPTDDYDITLTDSDGIDIMGDELANRDTANTEQAIPKMDQVYGSRRVNGTLTLTITNNSVNSAVIEVKVYYYR